MLASGIGGEDALKCLVNQTGTNYFKLKQVSDIPLPSAYPWWAARSSFKFTMCTTATCIMLPILSSA